MAVVLALVLSLGDVDAVVEKNDDGDGFVAYERGSAPIVQGKRPTPRRSCHNLLLKDGSAK